MSYDFLQTEFMRLWKGSEVATVEDILSNSEKIIKASILSVGFWSQAIKASAEKLVARRPHLLGPSPSDEGTFENAKQELLLCCGLLRVSHQALHQKVKVACFFLIRCDLSNKSCEEISLAPDK